MNLSPDFFARLLTLALLVVVPSSALPARSVVDISPFFHAEIEPKTFDGPHLIGGGVFLEGQAEFYVERAGASSRVPAKSLTLRAGADGATFIDYAGAAYRVEIHLGLACPLGQFIARDGSLLYSLPPTDGPHVDRELTNAGLVQISSGEWLAKEFKGTIFEALAEKADFARTEPLPRTLNAAAIDSVNRHVGNARGVRAVRIGSYLNSDRQIVYKAYLVEETKSVDVAGVPLRYYWDFTPSGKPLVSEVEALSQRWGAATMSNLTLKPPSQYDVVVLYQTGALLRQISKDQPTSFKNFVAKACR